MSRSNSTGVPAWESEVISGKNNNMQDLFDDQSIDWATFDRPSHDLELHNVSHAKPDNFYWPVPPPTKSWTSPLDSPPEFDQDMPPLLFESRSTAPKAGCEPTESNQPILDISKLPTTQPREQQQQQRPRFSHSYSDTSALTDTSLSYSHSVSSATSSNSSTSSTSNANHCITLCTQIITHLDTHLNDRTLGLDGLLRLSKSCTSGLLHVTNLETSQTDPNVLLLLCVALNQLSALFETNVPTATATDDSSAAAVPTLLFGSFQVEPEDRLALGARLLGREIQRCRQLLDRIRRIHQLQQQQRSREPDDAAAAGLLQKQWFSSLAGRLDRLVAAVTA